MPYFVKGLNVYQGFNFKKDRQTAVGFITELKINNTTIPADIVCKDPLQLTNDLPVVSVLCDVSWATGMTDSIHFIGQISATNRQDIALMVYLDLINIEVILKYTIYEYDPVAKKYFKSFHCNDAELKGLIAKNGSNLTLSVANESSIAVQSPINYSFHIGIKPQPIAQNVTIATASQLNLVKQWGIRQL